MFRVAVVVALASVLLTALALISCLSVEDKREIRGLPRAAWVLVILLAPLAGAIAWFLAGRPLAAGVPGPAAWRVGAGFPEPRRPTAPDDDPEFLRTLDQRTVAETDEEQLRRREEDLKRREDEQGRRDLGTDT